MFWNAILFAVAGAAGGVAGFAVGTHFCDKRIKKRMRRHGGRPLIILERHKLREQVTVLFVDNGQEAFLPLSELEKF